MHGVSLQAIDYCCTSQHTNKVIFFPVSWPVLFCFINLVFECFRQLSAKCESCQVWKSTLQNAFCTKQRPVIFQVTTQKCSKAQHYVNPAALPLLLCFSLQGSPATNSDQAVPSAAVGLIAGSADIFTESLEVWNAPFYSSLYTEPDSDRRQNGSHRKLPESHGRQMALWHCVSADPPQKW